jgi:hypothetical protein
MTDFQQRIENQVNLDYAHRPNVGELRVANMHTNIYNKLLVTLDGSPQAEATLPYAANLAHTMSLEQVVLLRVVE